MKLKEIKMKLAQMLIDVTMSVLKTDKAVLEYDGEEFAVGTAVFITDEATGERVAAADGEYVTEEGKVITVAEGVITSIADKAEEVTEEPKEETTDDVAAEDVVEETPAEEVVEEPKEDAMAALEQRVSDLESTIEELVKVIEAIKTDITNKLSMSAARPAAEEFEQITAPKKTGDSKVDRFLERYGKR